MLEEIPALISPKKELSEPSIPKHQEMLYMLAYFIRGCKSLASTPVRNIL
jgi:hypothetical protein